MSARAERLLLGIAHTARTIHALAVNIIDVGVENFSEVKAITTANLRRESAGLLTLPASSSGWGSC